MTMRLRLALHLVGWAWRGRKQPRRAVSRLALCCRWVDCDLNRHMNNARYLSFMDLGRWDLLLVSGLGAEMWRRRWAPVAVRVAIDYKRSLAPGERFDLETFSEPPGARSVVIRQRFWRGEELVADAEVVILFLAGGQVQPLASLYDAEGVAVPVAPPGRGAPVPRYPEEKV